MVSCVSCGCSLTPKHKTCGVTFHSFPKDPNRRTKWIQFVNKFEFIPKRSSVLCSHHFADDCFDRSSKLQVRLLANAIPTIEVDRLKYVRSFNPITKTQSTDNNVASISGPSVREQTPSPDPEFLRQEVTPRIFWEYHFAMWEEHENIMLDHFGVSKRDYMKLATEVVVFMLVCVNEAWNIPIAYFFIAGINSQQKVSLVKPALALLEQVGVTN
ncbi:hypothetical protein HUJ05_007572 [Dendroctonus ponderosae]|nr:hypothetical protein HUJ05_007572 [Dendroctonus ponderosae]